MASSLTRTRHARYTRPARMFRRAGAAGGNEVILGYQVALNLSDRSQFYVDLESQITLLSDGVTPCVEALKVSPADEPAGRTNQYTFEEANAASIPGDLGLT